MPQLIHTDFIQALSLKDAGELPADIVYIPDGDSTITPSVNGKPKKITVRIPKGQGAKVAAALQAALGKRLGENVRPHVAFDHQTGRAAAIPESFSYEEGRGIVLKLSWTSSGSEAVKGRDYSYFSPAFLVDDKGVPCGLPARGEIGSLVNEPAFREIPKIAAGDEPLQPTSHHMSLILAALSIDPAHAEAEKSGVNRINALLAAEEKLKTIETVHATKMKAMDDENDELEAKLADFETKAKAKKKKDGEDMAKAAVACGVLKPADSEGIAEIVKAHEEGNEFAIKLIKARIEDAEKDPKRDLRTPIIKAGAEKVEDAPELTPMQVLASAIAEESNV